MTTYEEATTIIANASKLADKLFRDFGEIKMPIFHFKGDRGETVVGAPMFGDDDKDAAMSVVRRMLEKDNAEWVVVIAEAWVVETKNKEEYVGRPSEHPDRKEVIMYQFEGQGVAVSGKQDIVRPRGQRPYLDGLRMDPMTLESSGRMVGLLPRGKLSS